MSRPLNADQIEALDWLRRAADVHEPHSRSTPVKRRYVKAQTFYGLAARLCRPQLFSGLERRGLAISAEFGERPLHEPARKWREYAITRAGVAALEEARANAS